MRGDMMRQRNRLLVHEISRFSLSKDREATERVAKHDVVDCEKFGGLEKCEKGLGGHCD